MNGHYVARETTTPFGFITADDVEFDVTGPGSPVQIVNLPAGANTPGQLVITKKDNGFPGAIFAGACWQLFQNNGGARGAAVSGEICDDDDGANTG